MFPGFVMITTLGGAVVEANARAHDVEVGGIQPGRELWDLGLWQASAGLRDRVRDAFERAARGEHLTFDATVTTGRGLETYRVSFGPIVDASGAPEQVAVFCVELDPANRELEAPDRNALYRSIFEGATDGIFVADRQGRYIDANARGCELAGYTRDELLQLTLWDLSPQNAPPVLAKLKSNLRDERLLRRKDGTLVPIELTGVRLPDGSLLGLVRDISERRRVEEALRQREQELESLSDATKEALFVHQDGVILATNKAARELYRLGPDGAVGRGLFDFIAPESAALIMQHIAKASSEPYEAVARRADGTTFPAAVQARTTTFRGRPARLSAIQDLTELRALQASLAFADRMVSVGSLAAGVAHEINNPLTFITVGIEHVMDHLVALPLELGTKTQMLEILRDAQDGARRVAAIVRDLKSFSRADDDSTGPIDLAPVIHYAARMADTEIKHRAKLVLDLADLRLVAGNETRLGQVFLNLLINATQALAPGMADRNTITVSSRVEGDRVVVSVSDTGVGMDPSLVARIFEPFVTTKSHGTGLGLAISHGIVSRLGGTIEVQSAPGAGTTFRVALPVARGAPAQAPARPEAIAPPPVEGRPRVLVVDDEPLLIKATARILESDVDVVEADSARRALALFEQGEHFDVILCDLLMPEMTGIELFRRVSARWPELAKRVVFLTGGVFSREAAGFLETCGRPWLDKPFRPDALLALVHEIARIA